jgi:hypothetical protein
MAAGQNVVPFPPRDRSRGPDDEERGPRRPVTKLKKEFQEAVSAKVDENKEAAEAERYFHGVQWGEDELKVLKDRRQPVITFNRFKRKINTIVGIQEKMRQDPKAYPRNPTRPAQDGADLATSVLRYAMGWEWQDLCTEVARRCSVRGISGAEMVLTRGDRGDPEIEWELIDQRDLFYDPSSIKADFSDANFIGTTRWVPVEDAIELWPDYEDDLNGYMDNGPVQDTERGDERYRMSWVDRKKQKIRVVDHWYKVGAKWYYTIYCGETELEYNESPHKDEKARSTHKYELISYETDQDGDRYSAFRDLKSPQDEVNQRRSRALHASNSRRVIADMGAVDDVDVARREMARSDGWVIKNPGKELLPEDQVQAQTVKANMDMLGEAKQEIDSYGPNPGLIGTEIDPSSGRAIQLLQAAGLAEMGSYMTAFRHWKLRCYRKTWCACQQFWQAPRWIRVTDDDELEQFIQVNGWEQDPATGMPTAINQLAALDVDIIIDESADSINTMADTFDVMLGLAKSGAQIPPEMIIEMSPLPSKVKQKIQQQLDQSKQDPMQQNAMQLQLAGLQAKIEDLQTHAQLNMAQAMKAQAEANAPPEGPQAQIDTPADLAKANLDVAKADEIHHKIAVGAHAPKQEQPKPPPPPEPGLFELNLARARREHAAADQSLAGVDRERASAALQGAQQLKTLAEARTIDEAPEGMLQRPPPRPPTAPGGGA